MHVSSPPLTLLHAFPSFKVGGAQIRFATIANHFGASCAPERYSQQSVSFPRRLRGDATAGHPRHIALDSGDEDQAGCDR